MKLVNRKTLKFTSLFITNVKKTKINPKLAENIDVKPTKQAL